MTTIDYDERPDWAPTCIPNEGYRLAFCALTHARNIYPNKSDAEILMTILADLEYQRFQNAR